jgi:hypothetical protein
MGNQDYFDVLGVAKNSDPELIKAAYRALAKKHHPDCPGGSAERFREITRAWEALSKSQAPLCEPSLIQLKKLCEDLRRARDQRVYDDSAAKPSSESKTEGKSLFARVQHVALLVFGVGGFVLVLVAAIVLRTVLAPKATTTQATNDFLREIAKKPLQ